MLIVDKVNFTIIRALMIRHIVILHFKKSFNKDYLSLLKETIPFLEQILGINSYQIYPNESKYVPEDVCSIGVEIIFEDKNALNVFMEHPKHYEANSIFEEYLADPPYMVLTYEVPVT